MNRKLLPVLMVTLCAALLANASFAQHADDKKPAASPSPAPKPPADAPAKPPTDKPTAGQPSPEDMQAMMEQWMKLATPGDAHKRLEPLVGKWDASVKIFMAGPDAPPTESKGEGENEWVLGGRFLVHKFKGTMSMGGPAMPFEGMGMTGYDNFRNLYVGNWCDTWGTPMFVMSGAASPDGKTITMYGQMDEPQLRVVGRMVKYVTRITDHDKYALEMYDLHAGPDYKVMEITYTRKK